MDNDIWEQREKWLDIRNLNRLIAWRLAVIKYNRKVFKTGEV